MQRSVVLSILLYPLGSGGLPLRPVALHELSDCDLLRVLGCGRLQHSKNGFNDEFRVQSGDPLLLDSLRANLASVCLHAGVVNLCDELDLRRLEGIVVGEVEVDHELAANEGCSLGAVDRDVPDHNIILGGVDRDTINWLPSQIAELLINRTYQMS